MAKRSIEVAMIVTFANGDEELCKVRKLEIPKYITKMKDSDEKDAALEEHIKYLKKWLQKAIWKQECLDDYSGVMDSW